MASMAATRRRDVALHMVARTWARNSPADAAFWAEGLPDGTGDCGELAVVSMAGVHQLQARFCRSHAIQVVGFEWGQRSPQLALAWADRISDEKIRDHLIRLISRGAELGRVASRKG